MYLKIRSVSVRFMVLLGLMFATISLHAQSPRDRKIEESSVSAFRVAKYKDALLGFSELLSRYPRDPMYNYYHGVCLVSLNQEPEKAIQELRLAALGNVPGDVFFYLGEAAYQQNDYAGATKYFERFRETADSRTRDSYHVDRWLKVCRMYLRNPQPRISPGDLAFSYWATLYTAMKYQHKLDSVNYLIKKEKQITGTNREKSGRIAVLEEERKFYADVVSEYFTAVRKMETSGVQVPGEKKDAGGNSRENLSGTGKGNTGSKGGSPYLERIGDQFYKQPGISAVFDRPDQERLDQLMEVTARGNKLMEEALEVNNEIEKYKVIVNTVHSKREARQARRNIQRLEKKMREKRKEAIGYFQAANDEQYALYNKYLDKLILTGNAGDAKMQQGEAFRTEAEKSRKKALSLRAEAGESSSAEKKYDKLMEANAYELIALDNQKKAIGTLTGVVPVAGDKVDVTRPVADIPKTTIPQVQPATQKTTVVESPVVKPDALSAAAGKKETKEKIPAYPEDAGKKLRQPEKVNASPEKHIDRRTEMLGRFPYGFAVRSSLPYDEEHPVPEMDDLPEGVNYKIQIAAFSKQPDLSFFKGMYPLSREEVPGRNLMRYYTGLFRKYDDALKALLQVRRMGFPDAMIVGFYNGERSALERIRWLEDEFPYENISGPDAPVITAEKPTTKTKTGKIEPELVYRVQLGAFSKRVNGKKAEQFRRLAGEYEVKITRNNSGIYVYSIGNFITFDEAELFKTKLIAEGVEGVFVTAWKNGNRIPIKDAR